MSDATYERLVKIDKWLGRHFPWVGTVHPAIMMFGGLAVGLLISIIIRLLHK